MSIDPRLAGAKRMLGNIKKIIPVMSSKGGVGKTIISVILALQLSRQGYKTGLLDLDINDPNTHIVLGIDLDKTFPEEKEGVIPPLTYGIRYMTIGYYTKNNPTPLRGEEVDDAIKEILAITKWGDLDYLIVDTPPGLGDEVLDTIEYLLDPRPVIVSTPSPLSRESVLKLISLIKNEGVKNYGVIYNMVRKQPELHDERVIGYVNYDESIDEVIGNPSEILKTKIAGDLEKLIPRIIKL